LLRGDCSQLAVGGPDLPLRGFQGLAFETWHGGSAAPKATARSEGRRRGRRGRSRPRGDFDRRVEAELPFDFFDDGITSDSLSTESRWGESMIIERIDATVPAVSITKQG
jgi:hypothetical protein